MAQLQYHQTNGLPEAKVLSGIVGCMDAFMRTSPVKRWEEKFAERSNSLIQWVTDGDDVVGFKAGYELRPGLFYSWLGGVSPSHRRQGIAKRLMAEQHQYARSIGCKEIRTISTNDHKHMMILNLAVGFDIIETKAKGDETRIVMSLSIQ